MDVPRTVAYPQAHATSSALKACAILGAQRFAQVWGFDDFWKRANTFQAFLRFAHAAERRWSGHSPELVPIRTLRSTMIRTNHAYFAEYIGSDGVWADDYGWCGIACMDAYDHLTAIGDKANALTYASLAQRCWQEMVEIGYDSSDAATPVPHGCGNVSRQRHREGGGHGTRNTVTNINLLLLSLRLYGRFGPSPYPYRWMVLAQAEWFAKWFDLSVPSLGDGPYLRTIVPIAAPPASLIHERPMAEQSYTRVFDPTWQPGWVWSGDQGLLLNALACLLRADLTPSHYPAELFRDSFLRLANGIRTLLFGGADAVLREAPFGSSFNASYAPDYVGGRGVLLRYVSEPAVRHMLGQPFYAKGIRATALAVCNSQDGEHQFAAQWAPTGDDEFNESFCEHWGSGNPAITDWAANVDDYPGVLQANGLDALTAAIRLDTLPAAER